MTQSDKEIVLTYYASLNFAAKLPEYWVKGASNGFRVHYTQWMMLLNIRMKEDTVPDDMTMGAVENVLKTDYGHMNENCVTEAIKMNLRGEFQPTIEAYQLINENFLIKLLTAYNNKLLQAHRIAVALRNKAMEVPEPTPEETEAKNKAAMLEVFAEYKKTKNEMLISSRYYDFFNNRKMLNYNKAEKLQFMEQAKEKLKSAASTGVNMREAANIIKDIVNGGMQEDVIIMAKKITIIKYFNSIEKLEL